MIDIYWGKDSGNEKIQHTSARKSEANFPLSSNFARFVQYSRSLTVIGVRCRPLVKDFAQRSMKRLPCISSLDRLDSPSLYQNTEGIRACVLSNQCRDPEPEHHGKPTLAIDVRCKPCQMLVPGSTVRIVPNPSPRRKPWSWCSPFSWILLFTVSGFAVAIVPLLLNEKVPSREETI
jgi:hypothetical protein